MRPYLVVADIDIVQPEKFAVMSIDPTKRNNKGDCIAIVLSLHMTREEAEALATIGDAL